jgi:hypothetical protein
MKLGVGGTGERYARAAASQRVFQNVFSFGVKGAVDDDVWQE